MLLVRFFFFNLQVFAENSYSLLAKKYVPFSSSVFIFHSRKAVSVFEQAGHNTRAGGIQLFSRLLISIAKLLHFLAYARLAALQQCSGLAQLVFPF